MALTHPATWDEATLLAQCRIQRTRRSGPGGQHRNKVETAVVITFLPAEVRVEASERRSQPQNLRVAIRRLRWALARAVRSEVVAGAAPSPLWAARLTGKRLTISANHEDFPALLAEGLDVLYAHQLDPVAAAQQLGCSTSQLCRLLSLDPAAWQQVNTDRRRRGLAALRRR